MHHVTEHDPKQEGEHDDGEETGVDLLVAGNTVGIHDLLERAREVIEVEVGGRGLGVLGYLVDLGMLGVGVALFHFR